MSLIPGRSLFQSFSCCAHGVLLLAMLCIVNEPLHDYAWLSVASEHLCFLLCAVWSIVTLMWLFVSCLIVPLDPLTAWPVLSWAVGIWPRTIKSNTPARVMLAALVMTPT